MAGWRRAWTGRALLAVLVVVELMAWLIPSMWGWTIGSRWGDTAGAIGTVVAFVLVCETKPVRETLDALAEPRTRQQ